MTPIFIHQLVIHTVSNVTGDEPNDIAALEEIELNTRDWEQIFSRLEATLDIHTGMLTSTERTISIDSLTRALHAKLRGEDVIV